MIGVVHLVTFLDSQTGGMERQALQLAKKLRALGHDIFFITCAHIGRMRNEHLRVIDYKEDFRIYRIPLFKGRRYLNMLLYWIGAFIVLFGARKRYQIIHAHQLYTSGIVAAFGKLILRSKKVIVKNAAGGDRCGDVAELKRLYGSRFFITTLRRFVDQCIAVSSQTENEMRAIGLTRIQLIPNGVDVNHFTPATQDERSRLRQKMLGDYVGNPVVLFVGRFGPEKNLFTLMDAMAFLPSETHLYLVGDGALKGQLLHYAKEKGIIGRVHFIGICDDVRPWYRIADVFVLPSYSEGLPNTLLEAMSSGVPCAGSDIPGIATIMTHGENGYLFPVRDAHTLAIAIRTILMDHIRARAFAKKAREWIERSYTLDAVVRLYDTLYVPSIGGEVKIFP